MNTTNTSFESIDSLAENIALALSDPSGKSELVRYDPSDAQPVHCGDIGPDAKERLKQKGFLIVEDVTLQQGGDMACKIVAEQLGLNPSHTVVPQQYKDQEKHSLYGQSASNELSPVLRPVHGTFDSTRPIGIHVDGTHEAIGSVPYQILVCERQASKGGANSVYNVVNAFNELVEEDPRKAALLLMSNCFGRYSPGKSKITFGPVFAWNLDGELITRYSEEFVALQDITPELSGAFASVGTNIRYQHNNVKVRLKPGQALITRNDRVAHDREGFTLDENPRKFHRLILGK